MAQPAARLGDMHACPMQTPGVPPIPHVGGPIMLGAATVFIGGQPAATMGSPCICTGPVDLIKKGSTGVMIEGKGAARMGDMCAHGGAITAGCPTVLIGEKGVGDTVIIETMPAALTENAESIPANNEQVANQIETLQLAAQKGVPFCEECEKTRR